MLFSQGLISGCVHRVKNKTAGPGTAGKKHVRLTTPQSESESNGSESITSENGALTTRTLLEEGRTLSCTGAQQFLNGDFDAARSNLEAAMLDLQLADLPADMQKIGFFQPFLPDECRKMDLQKTYNQLMETGRKREFDAEESVGNLPASSFAQGDQKYIASEILRLMEAFGEEPVKPEELDVFVKEVEGFITYFKTEKKEWFERSYFRMLKYQDSIERIFTEKKLPVELEYLAFVESGYNYTATSRAQARGIWQFITSTAQIYDLRVSRGIDERLDPIKSTEAAREYFLDLIAIFGSKSFLLAMASYNAGEGKVQKCLRQLDDPFEDRSFWQIRDCLKQETRDYIPMIIAVAIICQNPQKFGFELPLRTDLLKERDLVVCPVQVRLASIAKTAEIDVGQLIDLNPDLPSGCIWTPVNNTHLWLPKGSGETVQIAFLSINSPLSETPPAAESALPKSSSPGAPNAALNFHIVKSGQTLCEIGRIYKVDYKTLADWNHIKYPYNLSRGQKIYVENPAKAQSSSSNGSSNGTICTNSVTYTIQKGNYLAGIASLFGIAPRDIMKSNQLPRGTIFPGQQLTICPGFPVEVIQHKVGTTETIYQISKRYNVPVEDILFCNGMKGDCKITAGSKLTIYRKVGS
jgi:membrane-bound lytic murein transglycosylase D